MRILVCGGRDYMNASNVWGTLEHLHSRDPITFVVEGGATGADSLAKGWALARKIPHKTERAYWTDISHVDAVIRTRRDGTKYNALAGHWRNQRMLDEHNPDVVIAFPGGSGTADMVARAHKAGVQVLEVSDNGVIRRRKSNAA